MDDQRRTIRVVDGEGAPLADAFVAIETSSVPFPEISLITDEDGTISILLPVGEYRIGARSTGGGYGVIEAGVTGEDDRELVIKVTSSGME